MFLYYLVDVLLLLLLSLIFSANVVADGAAQSTATDVEYRIEQLINSYRCRSFYLDVGTNVGVQIRKLFEPQLYSGVDPQMERMAAMWKTKEMWNNVNATPRILPIFDKYFGASPRCGVCAIGFEPNPRHSRRLAKVEQALRNAGFGVLILTETAVDVRDNTTNILLPRKANEKTNPNDVGLLTMRTVGAPLRKRFLVQTVRTVDLARVLLFVQHKLAQHAGVPGSLVVKIDIEGLEYAMIPHLLQRKATCNIDFLLCEWHAETPKKQRMKATIIDQIRKEQCRTELSELDDETFLHDGLPLINRSVCSKASL